MVRFLIGVILGAVVCGAILVALAVLFPLSDGPVMTARAPTGAAPEQAASAPEGTVDGPQVGSAPEIGGGTGGLSAPSVEEGAGAAVSDGDDAAPSVGGSAAPQVSAGSGAGSGPSVDTESAAAPQIDDSAAAPGLPSGNALADNAIPFEGAAGRPLLALVLLDDGGAPGLRPGLTALRAPLTVAVAADLTDAPLVAAEHRGNGFEVAVLPAAEGPMSLGAERGAPEVAGTLAVLVRNVPEATALIEAPDAQLPAEGDVAGALAEALAVTGHGLLAFPGAGAEEVTTAASEAGVPAATTLRLLSASGDPAEIVAALDNAVAEAEIGGSAVVVARLRPATVGAMQSWLLSGGAQPVTLAPVSAVLTAE